MLVAIHQPEYLPWLGYLDKVRRADVFVLLDSVQFNRASLQHRAKIASPRKPFGWLTIPFVHCFPQLIRDVKISDPSWAASHRMMLRATYGDAPGFAAAWPAIEAFYENPGATVAEVSVASMHMLLKVFGIEPRSMVTSTELGAEGAKGDLVLDICRRVNATCYLAGKSGAEYLDRVAFADARVAIEVQSFAPPEGLAREVPALSAIDAWMKLGGQARDVFSSR